MEAELRPGLAHDVTRNYAKGEVKLTILKSFLKMSKISKNVIRCSHF